MRHQKLIFQMTRYHENMKPRPFNPTFMSSSVCATLGTTLHRSQSLNSYTPKYNSLKEPKIHTEEVYSTRNSTNLNDLQQKRKQTPSQIGKSLPNLKSYGLNSLKPISKPINDKTVYQKQSKQFNIITSQPRQFKDTIRMFPKLRLENQDEHFYKKLIAANQLKLKYKSSINQSNTKNILNKKLDLNPQIIQKKQKLTNPVRGRLLTNMDELAGIL